MMHVLSRTRICDALACVGAVAVIVVAVLS